MREARTMLQADKECFSPKSPSFLDPAIWDEIACSQNTFLMYRDPSFISPHVRPQVAGSWIRSLNTGVLATKAQLNALASVPEFEQMQARYQFLIETARPLIEIIQHHNFAMPYQFDLMSRKGIALLTFGNIDNGSLTFERSIINESTVGTNAHSLCMRHRTPFSIVGPEHFSNSFKHLAAIAVPIINNDDIVIASLLLTQELPSNPYENAYQEYLLQLVTFLTNLAKTIEAALTKNFTQTHKPNRVNQETYLKEVTKVVEPSKKRNSSSILVANTYDMVLGFEDILGISPTILSTIETAKRYASTTADILIGGQSGSGKKFFAQAIHDESPYQGPFVAIQCDALSGHFLENDLPRIITDAQTKQALASEKKNRSGGTLFFDEISDMPFAAQTKLLHLLNKNDALPPDAPLANLGGFRIVSTTRNDLSALIKEGLFREDLMYRLAELTLFIPCLKDRGPDCLYFAKHFLQECNQQSKKPPKHFSQEALRLINTYEWPGNIRQLHNAVFTAHCSSFSDEIGTQDLPLLTAPQQKVERYPIRVSTPSATLQTEHSFAEEQTNEGIHLALPQLEAKAIKLALLHTRGNVERAASVLDVSAESLYRKIKDYNIESDSRIN